MFWHRFGILLAMFWGPFLTDFSTTWDPSGSNGPSKSRISVEADSRNPDFFQNHFLADFRGGGPAGVVMVSEFRLPGSVT